ncbi:rnhA operon protein [Haladaptatus pallidirubidus]|uniref:RnhA operon protein n=1 Tax=Haladaptatus pallidirubidus TaxID=1008152 RepID=A0AAV3UBW7_9EURY|nr:rnhA operon protein [Haladaptatus pallidirubidus]
MAEPPNEPEVPDESKSQDKSKAPGEAELPRETVEEAERLTHLARDAEGSEADAYQEKRDRLLAKQDFVARVREDETRRVLVLHPDEWLEAGTIQVERIEDTERAVEIPLDGPGDPDDWDEIDTHNRAVAATVREQHGEIHGANAEAFAGFMSNHYARPVESATNVEVTQFRTEYFPRNAWPTDEQKSVVETSIELVFDCVSCVSR